MTPNATQHLDDVALMMYLDGESTPEVAMHVTQCLPCSRRAGRLSQLQAGLERRLYRSACPTSLELGEYELRLVTHERAAELARHLATCPHCTNELAQLKTFLNQPDPYLKPDPLISIERHVRVLIGRLVGGSSLGRPLGAPTLAPALAGLRGAAAGPMTYEAEELLVLVEITDEPRSPGRRSIAGLVMGSDDPSSLQAHLWTDDHLLAASPVDEIGNFVIGDLTPGHYELIIANSDAEIHIQDLEVA